ncbi:DEAD/DEAH box helicase [Dictyocaulus viviparus]|uniref:ATP-dependent RNA helicase n=1 Tax=Dictyocaulus viviparus TaxID=29172 RepID=A0A0D8YA51_DICVI|nr:DEAD/DEAH box helicase [Dictyocaulus viviparus]
MERILSSVSDFEINQGYGVLYIGRKGCAKFIWLFPLRFESPTEIQRRVLPIAVRDRCDVLGAAETGSGKTLAYGIPITVRLLEMSEDFRSSKTGPKALILAPTRELVMQVMKHVTVLLKYTDFKVLFYIFQAFPIVGGLAQVRQARILNKLKPEVIVATPGRLWAMMKDPVDEEPGCQYLSDWAGLLCLVIDETDRMVEKGHFHELEDILKRVRKYVVGSLCLFIFLGSFKIICCSEKLQTLVFSATLTYVHYNRASDGRTSTEHNLQKKLSKRSLAHCANASRRVYGILKLLKFRPLMIHAKMEQKIRLKNLENFTADPRGILLATDVAARGLDIQCIDNVIHYQVPKTAEIYIHRSGRTARASRKGLSVLIVDLKDSHLYQKLCKNLNREKDLPVFPIDCPDLMKHLVIRVKLASALDSLAHKKKKIHLSENWFSKVLRDAELEMDDARQSEQASSNAAMDLIRAEETRLQAELKAELAAPLPSLDRMDLPKTRYINPDIIARYEKVSFHM